MAKGQRKAAAEKEAGPDLSYIADGLRGQAVALATLVPDPHNLNTHNDKSLEAIAASLREFGQQKAIVVQAEGMIVRAGNGTLAAAQRLGWTHLAVNLVTGRDETWWKRFAIVDNRTAELSEWDTDALLAELELLELPKDEDLAALFADLQDELSAAPDEDAADEPAKKKKSGTQPPPDEGRKWQVLVTCRDDAHQREVLEMCQQKGWDSKSFAS